MPVKLRIDRAALACVALAMTLTPATMASADPVADIPTQGEGMAVSAAQLGGSRAVVERRVIGESVRGREIYAFRLGNPDARITAVVVGSMHGDEPAGTRLARALLRGAPVRHINLWVVPTLNPDGLAAHRRQNAHGVDLNRNWRHNWQPEGGRYNSGPRPFSEPETWAMRRFLNRTDPNFIVSFHQPLYGVDADAPKNRNLMNRLAENLNLPKKPILCHDGVCHGTMTGWFNSRHAGACITVEFGYRPSWDYLTGRAARGTVRAVLGRY